MTDYELFAAFLAQSGVAHKDTPDPTLGPNVRCVEFDGAKRGHKVDGHGRLEILFEADGSLRDFCFWD